MKNAIRILILFLSAITTAEALSQQYKISSQVLRSQWSPGSWSGEHKFYDVYWLTFPQPETAKMKAEVFFNANAINLTQVSYPDKLAASVVVSSLPAGRSAEQEINILLKIGRRGEKEYEHDYHISTVPSKFGTSIQLRIKDVAPAGSDAVFPLIRPIYKPARPPIQSMSVHRLFVRGPDRFEVAVLQLAPENANDQTEGAMQKSLTLIADQIVTSLQNCTEKLPLRIVK